MIKMNKIGKRKICEEIISKIKRENKLGGIYKTIEEIFDYKGFKCMIIFNELIVSNPKIENMKWRCGYVGIQKGHPFYKKHYDKIEEKGGTSVHGGLTFSQIGDDEFYPKDYWWIGFDCNHYKDDLRNWTFKRVKKEVKELAEQLTIKNLILSGLGK